LLHWGQRAPRWGRKGPGHSSGGAASQSGPFSLLQVKTLTPGRATLPQHNAQRRFLGPLAPGLLPSAHHSHPRTRCGLAGPYFTSGPNGHPQKNPWKERKEKRTGNRNRLNMQQPCPANREHPSTWTTIPSTVRESRLDGEGKGMMLLHLRIEIGSCSPHALLIAPHV
jgi:hypothetical protein